MAKYYCKDCGKEIKNPHAKRCVICAGIAKRGLKRPDVTLRNKYRNQKGKNNGNFKNWSSKKRNICIDCGKILGNCSYYLNIQRCKPCETKLRWTNIEYKERVISKTMKNSKLSPNKKEKILLNILKNLFKKRFEYIGQGKRFIGGFCPDFIDIKNKKIIEFNGTYWHNLENVKIKDIRKYKIYKKLGYKYLIIKESELLNINKLMQKLIIFSQI